MESRNIHSYVADEAQLKGFCDGTIHQVWMPIEEYHVDWMVEHTVTLSDIQSIKEVGGKWWWGVINERWGVYIYCPYVVGDTLTVKVTNVDLNDCGCDDCIAEQDIINFIHLTITNIEAKTLGEIEGLEPPSAADDVGMYRVLMERMKKRWNTRYPKQPWDKDLWCWKIKLDT